MEPRAAVDSPEYAALVAAGDHLLVALDFDGTLAPIVDDPQAAVIHEEAPEVLVGLAAQIRAVAVLTHLTAGCVILATGVGLALEGRWSGATVCGTVVAALGLTWVRPGRRVPDPLLSVLASNGVLHGLLFLAWATPEIVPLIGAVPSVVRNGGLPALLHGLLYLSTGDNTNPFQSAG